MAEENQIDVLQKPQASPLGAASLKQQLYLSPRKASSIVPPKIVSEIKRQGSLSPTQVSLTTVDPLCAILLPP